MNRRFIGFPVAVALILGLLCQAACHRQKPAQEDFVTSAGFVNCFLEGFTEADPEGFIEQMKESFVVRRIKGKILDSEGTAIWFKDQPPLLEIRAFKALTGKPLKGVHVDKNGDFEMEEVPEGPYCFKATMDGWRSILGVIVVSKKADPKKTILLKMLLGN